MVVSSRGDSSFSKSTGGCAFLLRRNFYRHDLRLEAALFHRSHGFAVRVHGELILLFARDAVFFRNVLAGDAHVVVVVNIPKPVVHHGIDDLTVAQTISFSRLRQQIGSVRHGFHAARNHDGTVSGLHRLRCESHRFQSRATNFVDCHGTCGWRQSAEDCRLAGGILSQPGGKDVAHDAFVDLIGVQSGALYGLAHHHGTELRSTEIGETALEFSHRCTTTGNDDNLIESRH